jgi:hypothetical protein
MMQAAEGIIMREVKTFCTDFVSRVMAEVGPDRTPPCAGGDHTPWTDAIYKALEQMGKQQHCEVYPWLLDRVWWSREGGRETMVLGVESELDSSFPKIEEDFQKLPSFKCPRKLLVFSANPDETKNMVATYLQHFTQNVAGEQYILIGFTTSGPRCYFYHVPADGKPQERVSFKEL